jgi:hypothetical protein
MEKSRSKSLHLQGGAQEDHHLAISGCRNGHGPGLNGEPYALKGARTVRGGEALMRFLLHSRWRAASCISLSCSTGQPAGCCHGGCRSRWKRLSASRPWRMLWLVTADRKSSTPTRARSSPARHSPACSPATPSPSAWTAKGLGGITSSSKRLWRSVKYEEVYLRIDAEILFRQSGPAQFSKSGRRVDAPGFNSTPIRNGKRVRIRSADRAQDAR